MSPFYTSKVVGGHLRRPQIIFIASAIVVTLPQTGCGDRSSQLGGEANVSMPFYGRVVDQDGAPVAGANVAYQVEAYPSDWSFNTRNADHVFSEASAVSAADGTFTLNITGAMIRMRSVTRSGYNLLWEENTSDRTSSVFYYRLIGSGRLVYRSNPAYPAVYIMVKNGLDYSCVLSCRGGSAETLHGWIPNAPMLPSRPSIKGIRFLTRNASTNLAGAAPARD